MRKSQFSNPKDPNQIKSPDLKTQICNKSPKNLLRPTAAENKTVNYAVNVEELLYLMHI